MRVAVGMAMAAMTMVIVMLVLMLMSRLNVSLVMGLIHQGNIKGKVVVTLSRELSGVRLGEIGAKNRQGY
jgi:hypothetical protein